MAASIDEIKTEVKNFILEEYLPGEDSDSLTDDTELVTHGVLDSLSTLQLVTHLEMKFDIKISAHEVNTDNLNTLPDIANLVSSKLD